MLTIETRHQATIQDAIRLGRERGVEGDSRVYTLIDVNGVLTYWGPVTIGSENKFTGIKDCSMVQATYRLNGQIVGTMAVLGPTRMEYRKVIAVMNYLHKYLETILKDPK